jgi:hypothetical protein
MPWAEFKPSSSGYKDQRRRNLNILLMSIKWDKLWTAATTDLLLIPRR